MTFAGRREPARRGDRVTLRYRRAGGDYATVARTTTDARGRYAVSAQPRRKRFHYRGTTRRIEVIDHGPFIAGRRWDLTNAARRKLGFPNGVDDIWADG